MPATGRVSVGWQIVFTFLPILDLWAFYRIKKLQKYVLYAVVPSIVLSIIAVSYIIAAERRFIPWGDDGLVFGSAKAAAETASIMGNVIGWGLQGFSVYLVIIWSKRHNQTFDTLPL
ncbi:MAG TPA: hypothetical protein VF016_00240 [Nitrososphaera sp.]